LFTLGDNKYDAGVAFGGEAGFLAGVLFRKGWLRSRCWRSLTGLRLNTVWWSEIKHKYEYE